MIPQHVVSLIALGSLVKLGSALAQHPSRRRFVLEGSVLPAAAGVVTGTGLGAAATTTTTVAWAAPPVAQKELETPGARLIRDVFRPKPPRVLRPKLDKDFAVLLMRSSYNALDDLDCVAMDQFQRDFFLIRQVGAVRVINSGVPALRQLLEVVLDLGKDWS